MPMTMHGPTTDHNEIRRWVESRHGCPVELMPQRVDHEPLLLGLYFGPDAAKENGLRTVTWDDFFARFDLMGLAFVYDDDPKREAWNSYEILQIDSRSPYSFGGSPT